MIKKIIKIHKNFLVIVLISFALSSCKKNPDHSVRVHNELSETLFHIKLGAVDFRNLATNHVSDFIPVREGDHVLTGKIFAGVLTSEAIKIKGEGTQRWTLTVVSRSQVSLQKYQ
jgi:hypothetical protein